MVYATGEAHGNCLLASRIYQANNPDLQRYPLTKCFVKLKERFERTANANYEKTARTHACSNQDRQIDIVGCAIQNPSISIREISDEISISKSVVLRTLKKNNFHPYHPEHHQFLTEQDCQKRVQFCEWATIKLQDENFFSKVLFTAESSFANTGRENRHNYHHYADQNPRLMREDDHQHRFKVNVWAGICGEYVIGPHFLEGNLTGNRNLQFLQNDLLQLQRHIPPPDLNSQWFQHDGAPAHSTLAKPCLSHEEVALLKESEYEFSENREGNGVIATMPGPSHVQTPKQRQT
ncbi:hypothetical protein NQ315_012454 [Exocentrus adspersus]|uniref:Transposase Tc1-like domain-containing protein n=1 Tax=Exocentrus adspersus TaxID=1586481 RepID=A0AAV8VNE7_9CUCU|nr:hypothetical protein NQ315_012454 [Exocentrus adspersus]